MNSDVVYTLFSNIDKIHTTPMGIGRIKRNLKLDLDDGLVVDYCIKMMKHYDEVILKGKNYYIHVDDMIFTVNRNSFTIITAHLK